MITFIVHNFVYSTQP